MNKEKLIIDAKNGALGRIASNAAKLSLLGKEIIIVNCNLALISGRKTTSIDKYNKLRSRGSSGLKGPHYPKNPERIMKRTIRGMLSHRDSRGLLALKRIICYNDTPEQYVSSEKLSFTATFKIKTITLLELSNKI